MSGGPERDAALQQYVAKVKEHREFESKVKKMREQFKEKEKEFDKSELDLLALQSVGQIIGEVLKQLGEEKYIVKASSGPRYVVACKQKVDRDKLVTGTRVALDMTTLTVMRVLPREVDPMVFNMLSEPVECRGVQDPGKISYAEVGGLNEQIRAMREVVELPLTNPELFKRVGIKTPKGAGMVSGASGQGPGGQGASG